MMEIRSSETWVLTTATRRNIPEGRILRRLQLSVIWRPILSVLRRHTVVDRRCLHLHNTVHPEEGGISSCVMSHLRDVTF
jgi:hypothetical protein